MTDLHTHILPGIDDGAKTAEESIALLKMEREQGVDTVVLTPHFYRDRENPERFLRRRKEAVLRLEEKIASLPAQEREALPELRVGAEVAWWPTLVEWDELPELCIEGTKNMLLELPFTPWNDQMINRIYDLMGHTGITPVIAHLERYLKIQRPELVREVLNLGVPIQVSGDVLLRMLSRRNAMKLLREQRYTLVASDCHNTTSRLPNAGEAMKVVEKKLGKDRAVQLLRCADRLAGL